MMCLCEHNHFLNIPGYRTSKPNVVDFLSGMIADIQENRKCSWSFGIYLVCMSLKAKSLALYSFHTSLQGFLGLFLAHVECKHSFLGLNRLVPEQPMKTWE